VGEVWIFSGTTQLNLKEVQRKTLSKLVMNQWG